MIFLLWLVSAVTLIIVSQIVPGFHVESFYSALVAAALLGLANIIIKPIAILLTLPINIVTLGLFTFAINALMLLLVATIVKGFTIDSFGSALLATIIMWLISLASNWMSQQFNN